MRTPAVRLPGRLVPLLLLAVVAFVWACAVPAAAHDVLVASDPADGATLDAPPDRVVLSFSAEQMPLGHAFEVLDPDGVDHVVGEPAVDGRDLVQELDGLGPAGTWTVAWRSVASDGHPVSGTFAFTVTNPAPDDGAADEGAEADDDAPASPEPATQSEPEPAAEPDPEPEGADTGTPAADEGPRDAEEPATAATNPLLVGGLAIGAVAAAAVVLVALRRRARDGEDRS